MTQDGYIANELTRPGKEARWIDSIYDTAEVLASAVLCIAVLFTFALRPAGVDGTSMLPTLEDKQMLAVTAILPQPNRGDIAILSPANGHHKPLVKRIIAIAGDEIDLVDGRVLVNGAVIDEPYLPEGAMTYPARESDMAYPVRVPAGHVFVMGDNRGGSSDSRSDMVGFVRVDDILGKAVFRIRPFFETNPFHFTYQLK